MKKSKGQMQWGAAGIRLGWRPDGGPIYRQLIEQVIASIATGKLMPGQRLPSSRELATTLGLSRTTTARALDQLIAEGYLTSEPRRGLFVASDLPPMSRGPAQRSSAARPRYEQEKTAPAEIIGFSSLPDYRQFPARAWAASLRRSWLRPSPSLLNGDASSGFWSLKTAIVDYLHQVRSVDCGASNIIITGGNRDALGLITHTLKQQQPEAHWWVESPGYPPVREALQHNVEHCHWLELDDQGLILPPSNDTAIVVATTCQHFPLGQPMSRARRQAWQKRLNAGNTWLIEDDYDNEFRYEGSPSVPLFQADHSGHTLLIGSFSKVMFKGLRLGFIVAPASLRARLQASQNALGNGASAAMQPALADFMRQGHFSRHLNRMRRHQRQQRDRMCELLKEYLQEWCEWRPPSGGMHVVVYLRPALATQQQSGKPLDQWLTDQLRKQAIKLDPLSRYYPLVQPSTQTILQGFVVGFTGGEESESRRTLTALRHQLIAWQQSSR
ncbi:GntR family transcriptional regulator [Halomonas cupida]|uniref:GntR family transcriptional regulator n=1 Tax=Halomonas cupida TaxID=44933 RepID=A0A1M7ISY3_9GAMM|nr:PLP-dependent aminotransferase family protein [Halomonas cupida]GEN24173.1 GntR family transcriptional regulator [Halomonas cupida]SHM43733.1 GntR family transcriptional regulator / MocR family aminotransferase [Halomonas cupida]